MLKSQRPIRLRGKQMERLRRACFKRDKYRCVKCGKRVLWDGSVWTRGHMMHKVRKTWGGDVISNVETGCFSCHFGPDGHANGLPARFMHL